MNEPASPGHRAPTQPADGLSILALASGIAAVVLVLFSVIPLVGMCMMPLSALSAATALLSGIASLIRTTMRPELDGRYQALAGLGLAVLWGAGMAVLLLAISKH